MRSGPTELLSRSQRLERAGPRTSREALVERFGIGQSTDTVAARSENPTPRCLFWLGPLPNGSPVCSDKCDDG
jgi:hypothetical protein